MKKEAFETLFETVLLAEITELNGDITEEALNMAILESILEDRIKEIESSDKESLVKERLNSEIDTENTEANGAYVYNAHGENGLVFNKHETIADAVREAVKMINSSIICDGVVMPFDIIDNKTAYYIDDRINKVKIVNL